MPIIATVFFSTGYVFCSFLENGIVLPIDIGDGQIFLRLPRDLDLPGGCVSQICRKLYGS